MHALNLLLLLLGAVLLALGMTSGLIRNRWSISEPLVAMLAGVLVGPAVLGWLSIGDLGGGDRALLEQAARLTLGIALMDVALSLPRGYPREQWRTLAIFVGLLLPAMWVSGSLLAAIFLGAPLLMALLVGAVLAPTDPVIASSIATGKLAEQHVPPRIRNALLSESGANDALSLPLVLLPLAFLSGEHASPWTHWIVGVVVWEVMGAVVLGLGAGLLAGRVLLWARDAFHTERASMVSVSLALVLLLLGASKLVRADGLLAVFVAGLTLNELVTGELEEQKALVHETLRRFFELPIFLLVGLALPWSGWVELGWPVLLLAAAVLALRRLPAVLLLARLAPPLRSRGDAWFVGWFGPMGVATLYYGAFATRESGSELPWLVATLVVASSVLVHGVGATGLTRLYGRNRAEPQGTEASELRGRSSPA